MRYSESFVARYLEAVGDVLRVLTRDRDTEISPMIAFVFLLVTVSVTSFLPAVPLGIRSFVGLIVATVIAFLGRILREYFKVLAVAALFLTVVGLPLLLSDLGVGIYVVGRDGLTRFIDLLLRCLGAVAIAVAWIGYAGFSRVLAGLYLIDRSGVVAKLIHFTIRYIPVAIREVSSLLVAREARLITSKLSTTWYVLASCCGDLLLRCFYRAWRVYLAFEARSLAFSSRSMYFLCSFHCGGVLRSYLDCVWLIVMSLYLLVYLVEVLHLGCFA